MAVDINQAKKSDLTKIKGVGKALAQRILDYRENEGDFKSVEELSNVKGVGKATLSKFVEEFSVGNLKERKLAKGKKTVNKKENIDKKIEKKEEKKIRNKSNKTITFMPRKYNITPESIEEVHLVGDFNDWNPENKNYQLQNVKSGVWVGNFDINKGEEYKIMYDSQSWEEGKHIGNHDGSNFIVE